MNRRYPWDGGGAFLRNDKVVYDRYKIRVMV